MRTYRIIEKDPARGEFVHFTRFETEESAERWIEKMVIEEEKDMFGEDLVYDEDYDYTAGPVYERFSIVEDEL